MSNQNQLLHELLRGIIENKLKQLVNLKKSMKPVQQVVQEYKENIIPPPLQFQELKEYNWIKFWKDTISCDFTIRDNKDPLIQLQNTIKRIEITEKIKYGWNNH